MKNNIDVSIIIPTYNSSKTIKRAIKSVINQTFTNWEIIIVDEFGSNTDFSFLNGKNFCSYKDRIILIKNDIRLGSRESRNKGIKLSKSKYISFLDADDEFLKDKIYTQVSFMENNKDFIGCGCQMQIYDNNHKTCTTDWHSLNEDVGYATLIFSSLCWTSSIMFNRKKFIQYDLFPIYDVCEDYQMVSKCVMYGRFKNVGGVMVNYYYNGSNLSLNSEVIENEKKYRVIITKNYLSRLKIKISNKNVYKFLLCNFNKYKQERNFFDVIKCKLLFIYLYFFAKNIDKKSLKHVLKQKYIENYTYYSKK